MNPENNKPVQFTFGDAERIAHAVKSHERSRRGRKPSWLPRAAGNGGGEAMRLGQFSGEWKNEPPENVKAVQLFIQPDTPASAADWIPETDSFGDPVFAVTVNFFSHVPVGQGDLIKWCAVVPISDLAGEYDTGQVISNPSGPPTPIMKSYDTLWLLIAAEC